MAHFDRARHRIDLKIVYWGPARGGKTTSLKSLHGAFGQDERGALSAVETEDERTYYFDYAPLQLPKYREFSVVVHAYTVPGQDAYHETRRRILQGADGVVFVADAAPAAETANVLSWKRLDEALQGIEAGGPPRPVVVAANKQDLPGAVKGDEIARRLAKGVPARPFVSVVETTAILGKGVGRCFRGALVAAADHALGADSTPDAPVARRAFLGALDERLKRVPDGVAVAQTPAARSVTVVPMTSNDPEAGGLEAALQASRALAVRELDLLELQRERGVSRLLLDASKACIVAVDEESLARGLLALLATNLEAAGAWLGLPDPTGTEKVFDPRGPSLDGAAASDVARAIGVFVPDLRTETVSGAATTRLPVPATGGSGFVLPFPVGSGRRGWLLLVATTGKSLPLDSETVLESVGGLLGPTIARLSEIRRLREAVATLEARARPRPAEPPAGASTAFRTSPGVAADRR